MKKLWLLTSILIGCFLFYPKNTLAFSSSNYQYKSLCGNYEVAGMHSDGVIDPVACLNTFEEAQAWMKNNGADDLVVFGKVSGKTKILDANVALVDLSVNPETLTYFYTDKEKTSSYTYMDTGSLYGGVDGALIDASYSNAHGRFMIKVKIGNFTGWILDSTYEIVPITWVKSSSSYTVTNEESAKASGFLFLYSYSYEKETADGYRYMYKRADGGIIPGKIDYTKFEYPENVTVVIYEDDSSKPKVEIWRDFELGEGWAARDGADTNRRTEYRFTIPTGSIVNYYNPQGIDQNQKEKSE